MGVSKKGVPQNGWFIMENPIKWMTWGYPYFRKHPHIAPSLYVEEGIFQRTPPIPPFIDPFRLHQLVRSPKKEETLTAL